MPLRNGARWEADIVFCNMNTSRDLKESIFSGIVETEICLKGAKEG